MDLYFLMVVRGWIGEELVSITHAVSAGAFSATSPRMDAGIYLLTRAVVDWCRRGGREADMQHTYARLVRAGDVSPKNCPRVAGGDFGPFYGSDTLEA